MSLRKKCVMFLVVFSLVLLTACANISGDKESLASMAASTSGYLEKDVPIPEGGRLALLGQDEKQNVEGYFYFSDTIKAYRYNEKGEWQALEMPWLEEISKKGGQLVNIETLPTGEKIVGYVVYKEQNGDFVPVQYIEQVDVNGQLHEITLEEADHIKLYKLEVSSKGDIFTCNSEYKVVQYDRKGHFIRTYDPSSSKFAIAQEMLYTLNTSQNSVVGYDISTGEQKEEIGLGNLNSYQITLTSDQKGNVYAVEGQGIKKISEGKMEEIISNHHTSLNLSTLHLQGGVVSEHAKLLSFNDSKGENVLKSYVYVDKLPAILKHVDVYTLETNAMLEQAIRIYEKEHLDTEINLEIGVNEANGLTRQEAIRKLNQLLLAKEGPDIILMDGLDVAVYANQGVLEDLEGWFDEKEKANWYEKVAGAYSKEGKTYALSTHYIVPTLWGEKEIVEQIQDFDDLIAYAERHPKEELFSERSYGELIKRLYSLACPNFVEANGTVNKEGMSQFLEQLKILKQEPDQTDGNPVHGINYLNKGTMRELLGLAFHEQKVALEYITSLEELLLANGAVKACEDGALSIFPSAGRPEFEPTGVVAVSSSSKEKETCKELIRLMLGEELQSLSVGIGFPVNKEAAQKMIEVSPMSEVSYSIRDDLERSFYYKLEESSYTKEFIELGNQVDKVQVVDTVLVEMITQEAKDYFNGKITSDEAAEKIYNRSKLYLLEKDM